MLMLVLHPTWEAKDHPEFIKNWTLSAESELLAIAPPALAGERWDRFVRELRENELVILLFLAGE